MGTGDQDQGPHASTKTMQYRYLSKNCGLRVSVLGLGTWVTVGAQISDSEAESVISAAYESGVNLFDTAEVYAAGRAESVLGNVIQRKRWKRSSLVISTKIFWGGRGENERGLSRKHIIEGLDASLERLRLSYVDLVFAQRPDPHTPMEEIVRAMTHVINQGKAFYWGTSQWSAADILEAHSCARLYNLIPPTVEQPEYHMFHREQVERDLIPVYQKINLGAITWSPLSGGLLTGKYCDGIPEDSRASLKGYEWFKAKILSDEGKDRRQKIRELQKIAENLGCTPAQLAIAWVIRNENVSSALLGAQSVEQLRDNLKAVQVSTLLTDGVVNELESVLQNKPLGRRDYRA